MQISFNIDYPSMSLVNYQPNEQNLEDRLNNEEWVSAKKRVNPIYYVIPKGINAGINRMQWINGNTGSNSYSGNSIGVTGSIEFYKWYGFGTYGRLTLRSLYATGSKI